MGSSKEKTVDGSDEDEIHSPNDFHDEPPETDSEANDVEDSSLSDLTVSQQLSSSTPLRSETNTPQHGQQLPSQLRLNDRPEKSGSSGSTTSFLQRAHEDAKLASTRNKTNND